MTLSRVLIIAEAGVNHNGSLEKAFELIDAAVYAGADIIKFQTFDSLLLASKSAAQASYQSKNIGFSQSQRDMLQSLELPKSCYSKLVSYCQERGLEFLSSAFDLPSIDFLSQLGMRRWKIPSGEITNLPYLRMVSSFGLPVVLSTGMASLGEVEAAISVLELNGLPRSLITVLHCTSEYPAPPESINLHAMNTMASSFNVKVGYSDHTQGSEASLAAVALGACVIEKHLTLDRSSPGPDHKASMEPSDFKAMITQIRYVESILGDGIKQITPCERENASLVRKSLVAACDIKAGEVFSDNNLTVKRPGTGLSPFHWDMVIGKPASRDYFEDELIDL